jgi:hypothetical protein
MVSGNDENYDVFRRNRGGFYEKFSLTGVF